ncbi:hypothetical protein TNCV_936751 [Trichonephila clavipes]|nr:hypothetical protein TNCV_936751 [Trichonephila clavipes]
MATVAEWSQSQTRGQCYRVAGSKVSDAEDPSVELLMHATSLRVQRPPIGRDMRTKYQMIKFIDFCEVWFLPESVVRVAAIARDPSCHTPRH